MQALRTDDGAGDVTGALRRLTEFWSPEGAVDLRVDDVTHLLGEEARLTVYRAAQEALTNARKHAPGEPVTMHVRAVEGGVRFEARNACTSPPLSGTGFGVSGLRERARTLGGDAGLLCDNGTVCLWMTLPAPSRSSSSTISPGSASA